MGEFGAVSVVSGTSAASPTLPLHVEILYNEYQFGRRLRRGLAAGAAGAGHPGDQDRVAPQRGIEHPAHRARHEQSKPSMGRIVSKQFGDFPRWTSALDFPTRRAGRAAGPSGCGKTTLLRIIAGLETDDGQRAVPRRRRHRRTPRASARSGFVFQHYALFRHMTVFDNVAFRACARKPAQQRPSESDQAAR